MTTTQDPALSTEQAEIAASHKPAPKVTPEYINKRIAAVQYMVIPGTQVTICHITLDNGFSVLGESVCASPENFDQAIGNRFAYDNAFDKLWPLFGFLMKEALWKGDVSAFEPY